MDSLSLTEDSGISESCDDSEEAILTKMKLLARDLEQKLSLDSTLVQEIAQVSLILQFVLRLFKYLMQQIFKIDVKNLMSNYFVCLSHRNFWLMSH